VSIHHAVLTTPSKTASTKQLHSGTYGINIRQTSKLNAKANNA
jgi:hypothetical protein